jgi:hypothetical protein
LPLRGGLKGLLWPFQPPIPRSNSPTARRCRWLPSLQVKRRACLSPLLRVVCSKRWHKFCFGISFALLFVYRIVFQSYRFRTISELFCKVYVMLLKRCLVLVITVFGLCGCTATLTLGTAPDSPSAPGSPKLPTASANLPTPQLLRVGVGIQHGGTVTVRLLQDPEWKNRQAEQQIRLKRALGLTPATTTRAPVQRTEPEPVPSAPGHAIATGPTAAVAPL